MFKKNKIESEKVLALFKEEGPICNQLFCFETRPQQEGMLLDIIQAFNKEKIAFIEAGTGTGKSLAYLLPSLLVALHLKQRVVISTNTIALQEQLIKKDIPFIIDALNLEIRVELAKGMGNYLCLRKLKENGEDISFFKEEEMEQVRVIQEWSKKTIDGTKADLSFMPSSVVWEQVSCESDACNHKKCPFFSECFFFKARKKCEEAQLIVVNHHLLFSDIVYRANSDNYDSVAILPHYHHVVVDEAHHIESVALDHYSLEVSRWGILRLITRLAGDGRTLKQGKMGILKKRLISLNISRDDDELESILMRLTVDIPAQRLQLQEGIHNLFDLLDSVCQQFLKKKTEKSDGKYFRLRTEHLEDPLWKEEVLPRLKSFSFCIESYMQMIKSVIKDITYLPYEGVEKCIETIKLDIEALIGRLSQRAEVFKHFYAPSEDDIQNVRWCEWVTYRNHSNFKLVLAKLDVSTLLREQFFRRFSTIILTSATLATNKNFNFVRGRLGLLEEQLIEKIYDSPFDFNTQSLLTIPSDIPMPSDFNFNQVFAEYLPKILEVSKGNAFVLFTSYYMLRQVFDMTKDVLFEMGLQVRCQGDLNRQDLLVWFKETEGSVLFGTDSFWEGVDVVGESLRCVVIAKLPFKVPTEPLVQAQTEALIEEGKDPFMEFSVPQAIMKFKQGFGRLIRNKKDRGCIVCMDRRIQVKSYGRLFLNSLPKCRWYYERKEFLLEKMSKFYQESDVLLKRK